MENIIAAGNTEVPAFLALKATGFTLERDFLDGNRERELWIARNEHFQLMAGSPLELLGLYAMRSQRGEAWKANDAEIKEYLRRFYPDGLEGSGGER